MIKGLIPQLAEAGKIKIGRLGPERESTRGTTFRPPVKQDYFTITTNQRNAKGDLEENLPIMGALVQQGFADEDGRVRRLPIVLHADDIDDVFPTTYARYKGSRALCRGDGESATRWEVDEQGRRGDPRQIECPQASKQRGLCSWYDDESCRAHGTLHCSIALPGHAVAGAVYRWRTTSIFSIKQVVASLSQIHRTLGCVAGLPLTMIVSRRKVRPEGGRERTIFVVHLELRASSLADVSRLALERLRLRHEVGASSLAAYRQIIAAPADEDESVAEQRRVAQEFHDPTAPTQSDVVDVPESSVRAAPRPAQTPARGQVSSTPAEPAPPPAEPPTPAPEPQRPKPIARDHALAKAVYERFSRLCHQKNLTGQGDAAEADRQAFWEELCETALATHLDMDPTEDQARLLVDHMDTMLPNQDEPAA